MSKIKVTSLNKSYYIDKEEFKVLKDLDVKFNAGEFVAIYGESGSGKSTLMNVIGGLDIFQSGTIEIEGENIEEFTSKSMDYYRNRKIGFIFQEFNLLESLTLLDNVLMPMDVAGVDSKKAKKRAIELLTKVGLGDFYKKKVNQLSGGQKQRVAVARALANDPDIILADEPTGALDSQTSSEILSLLQEIANDGKLIVAITHSEEVAKYASRVVTLENGAIKENVGDFVDVEANAEEIEFKRDSSKLSFRKALKIARANLFSKKVRTFLVALGVSLGITGSIVITSISQNTIDDVNSVFSGYSKDESVVDVIVINPNDTSFESQAPGEVDQNSIDAAEFYVNTLDPEISSEFNDVYSQKVINDFETGMDLLEAEYYSGDAVVLKDGEYPQKAEEVYYNGNIASLVDIATYLGVQDQISTQELYAMQIEDGDEAYETYTKFVSEEILGKTFTYPVSETESLELTIVGAQEFSQVSTSFTALYLPYDLNEETADSYGVNANFTYYIDFNTVEAAEDFISEVATLTGEDTGFNNYMIVSIDNRALLQMVNTILSLVRNVFLVLISVSLVVSIFMVNVIVYISTIERKVEIGTLRAIGAKKRDITNIFVSEGVLIGTIAFIMAVVGSFLLMLILNAIRYFMLAGGEGDFFAFSLSIPWLFAIAGLIILIMFIASLAPAISASRQNPIDALREE